MIFALVLQYYAGLHAFSGIGASVVLFFSLIVLRMGPGLAMGDNHERLSSFFKENEVS